MHAGEGLPAWPPHGLLPSQPWGPCVGHQAAGVRGKGCGASLDAKSGSAPSGGAGRKQQVVRKTLVFTADVPERLELGARPGLLGWVRTGHRGVTFDTRSPWEKHQALRAAGGRCCPLQGTEGRLGEVERWAQGSSPGRR